MSQVTVQLPLEHKAFIQKKLCVIELTLRGSKREASFDFLLDIGSEKTYVTSQIHSLIGVNIDLSSVKTVGILGKQVKKYEGAIERFTIARRVIVSNVNVSVAQSLPAAFAKYNIFGILGADFLAKSKLLIDYPKELVEIAFSESNADLSKFCEILLEENKRD